MNNIEKIEINGHYVWVDKDAEIKDGDWMIRPNENPVLVTSDFWWDFGVKYHKIIAASPELNLEGVPTYVEWLADNSYEGCDGCDKNDEIFYKNGFIKGYQTAEIELPTWDDVRKAFEAGMQFIGEDKGSWSEIIEQLKQSKQ